MAKKVFMIFIKGFLQAILVIICMALCCVGGFFGTRYYYTKKASNENSKQVENMIGEAQIDDCSKNLIYVWNEEKSRISACVLEVFDTEKNSMDYITIPTSGQITISPTMYKKISQVNQEIPQVFTLSKLCSFFDKGDDTAFGYGVLILEDFFDIDVSYYSVVNKEDFEAAFEAKEEEVDKNGNLEGASYSNKTDTLEDDDNDDNSSGTDPYAHDDRFATSDNYADATTASDTTTEYGATTEEPSSATTSVKVQQLKESFLSDAAQYQDADSLKEFVSRQCNNIKSNLDIKNKLSYVEQYLELNGSAIVYHCVPGRYDDKTYVFDIEDATAMFRKCGVDSTNKEDEGDEASDDDDAEGVKSELFNIVILNASRTQGVAAKWSEEMSLEGYNVKQIDNYDTLLTDSLIIVREEGQGEEFLKYFKNASIQVGTVPSGADAELIIGTNDIK
ncbi:MAG: LytR C-terminal domain-containing protein [Lachnospira sp.]|nr:LytR C-terminal domain-containing protein [Lachnospira sp.]